MRFRLRTLLILLAVLPPLIWGGWCAYDEWQRPIYHLEVDPSGSVIRAVEDGSGRVLAEYELEHVSYDNP
jgi:hypothetical protein